MRYASCRKIPEKNSLSGGILYLKIYMKIAKHEVVQMIF